MKLRQLNFLDEDACVAEVNRLRAGYRAGGAWSLEQACWHLNFPVTQSLREPANPEPTQEERESHAFVEQVIAAGWPPGLTAGEEMMPPADPGTGAIDSWVASLRRLKEYRPAKVDAFIFGPLATDKFRKFVLVHAAHHLGFFEPVKP